MLQPSLIRIHGTPFGIVHKLPALCFLPDFNHLALELDTRTFAQKGVIQENPITYKVNTPHIRREHLPIRFYLNF